MAKAKVHRAVHGATHFLNSVNSNTRWCSGAVGNHYDKWGTFQVYSTQENCAIAMTEQCALYMDALKMLGDSLTTPTATFSKILCVFLPMVPSEKALVSSYRPSIHIIPSFQLGIYTVTLADWLADWLVVGSPGARPPKYAPSCAQTQ